MLGKRSPLLGISHVSMYQTMVQLRANKLVIYNKWMGGNTKSKKQQDCNLLDNFKGAKTYSGQMTNTSQKKLGFALDMLWQCTGVRYLNRWQHRKLKLVKQHLSFVTLTIPEQSIRINGKDAYNELLEPFIQWLTRTMKVTHYVWKAELQQPLDYFGNEKLCKGQLHYHLILPNYIDKGKIRNKWNSILGKAGMLGLHQDPPSTWIGSLKKCTGAGYLMKEVMKNCVSQSDIKKQDDKINQALQKIGYMDKYILSMVARKIEMIKNLDYSEDSINGKVWGCSENLQPKTVQNGLYHTQTKKFYEVELSESLEKQLHNLNIRYSSKESTFNLRSYMDNQDALPTMIDFFGREVLNPKYFEKRFEIVTMPNGYQSQLLDYNCFVGFDELYKPIYKKQLELYKSHLNLFGANIEIRESTKAKYIPLSNTNVDANGNIIFGKKSLEKSILKEV